MKNIICSAIHYDDKKDYPGINKFNQTGIILFGFRHSQIILLAKELDIKSKYDIKTITQGFITSDGMFVTREEAYKIALESGQITAEKCNPYCKLFSEDIY